MKRKICCLLTGALMMVSMSAYANTNSDLDTAGSKIRSEEITAKQPALASGPVQIEISGEAKLPGQFYLSFVGSRNLIMLDGKGNVLWSKYEEQPTEEAKTGLWDFKKHKIGKNIYYSYHDQTGMYDSYGLEGYAPGERVILDKNFNEIKRITFEKSAVTEKGTPLDGHDFLMLDINHYILSGYIKDTVYNIPEYPNGSSVVYSYLQEVKNGKVVWEWKSTDYPELYSLTVTDACETANDFANQQTETPDYVHFNSMRLNEDGNLICSFRHLNSILCLDRSAAQDQILWKLSGKGDAFGLADVEKTSSQHYATVDGNYITVFDNGNKNKTTRICSYLVDTKNMTAHLARCYRFDDKFSAACGAVQHIADETYVIGWGMATKDAVCMSVYDFAANKERMSVKLADPKNITYRCVYYE